MKRVSISKIYLIYYLVITAFVALRIGSNLGVFNFISDAFWKGNISTIIIQIGILFLLPLLLYKFFSKGKVSEIFHKFRFVRVSFRLVIYSLLLGVIAYILNVIIASIFSVIISAFGYEGIRGFAASSPVEYNSFLKFLLGVVFVAVLPGFCEEFLHRGMVLQGLSTKIGNKRAIIISSILFGMMHLNIEQVFYATILGFLMGLLSVSTNNIWPSIILHFTNNALNVYYSYANTCSLPGGNMLELVAEFLSGLSLLQGFIICFVVISVLVYLLAVLFIKLYKEAKILEVSSAYDNICKEVVNTGSDNDEENQRDVDTAFDIFMRNKFKNVDTTFEIFVPKQDVDIKKIPITQNLFLIGTLVMGVLITIATFIWGVL